jgi:hypothetical protein
MSDFYTAQELKDRIDSNDNRSTAKPYLLLLRERRKISCDPEHAYDGYEYVEQLSGDYVAFENLEKAIDWLSEDDPDYKYRESDVVKWYYQEIDETVNVFLTDKGVEDHYDLNRHNLRNPNTYGIHAFRNKEMRSLFNLIDDNISKSEKIADLESKLEKALKSLEFVAHLESVNPKLDASVWFAECAIKCRNCLEEINNG